MRILNVVRHWLDRAPVAPLTAAQIDTGYRLFWTKMASEWDAERRTLMAAQVSGVIGSPGFENNALERRFRVAGLDDLAHSGASLLALANVLHALDNFESEDDNEASIS